MDSLWVSHRLSKPLLISSLKLFLTNVLHFKAKLGFHSSPAKLTTENVSYSKMEAPPPTQPWRNGGGEEVPADAGKKLVSNFP